MQRFCLPNKGLSKYLGKLCISPNPSLRALRSNPFLLANLALMDRRVAALLAITGLCRPSLDESVPIAMRFIAGGA